MTTELREEVQQEVKATAGARLRCVIVALGVAVSSWYYKPRPRKRQASTRRAKPIPTDLVDVIVKMATDNPWYGYKRIAVMCRRAGTKVSNRLVYRVMREKGLLQKRKRSRKAELHQTAKLYELLPTGPNQLWQADVTYIHIPGAGWWYAVTVIDYYSRYLLALRLTWSYSAVEVIAAVKEARREAERIHGPLETQPFLVTDNGPSFIAR